MLVAAAAVLLAPLRCQCSVSLFSFPMISLSLAGRCYNRASCSAARSCAPPRPGSCDAAAAVAASARARRLQRSSSSCGSRRCTQLPLPRGRQPSGLCGPLRAVDCHRISDRLRTVGSGGFGLQLGRAARQRVHGSLLHEWSKSGSRLQETK